MLLRLTLTTILIAITTSVHAGEWPGWRGPRGDGISDETDVPTSWSATANIAWKTPIPGTGHSSPIVWGDHVFVTTCIEKEKKRVLLCLDRRDGQVLWQKVVVIAELEPKHRLNSYASSTPATDGKHVWVTFLKNPDVIVACYDFAGKEVWKVSPGKFASKHGFCSPPTLYKDMVIVNCDQDGDGYLVALDQKSGRERWRTSRPNKTRSYTPPLIVKAAGRMQMVLTGSLCTASYDPDTGKQIWILDGPTEQFVASMIYHEDLFFLTAGYPEYHVLAIKPDGQGDVTKTHVLWRSTRGAGYVPSPIAHDKHFFLVNDNGLASCIEAKTGKYRWQERLGKHHSASPVSANGHLYFVADEGVTYVLKAGPKFEVIKKNALEEECYGSPAVSQGQIFIRGVSHLWCIGKK